MPPLPDVPSVGTDPISIVRTALFVADIFGGLFADKDYPWARVDVYITQWQAKIWNVQTLDGQNKAQWRALAQTLADTLQARIDLLPRVPGTPIAVGGISLGYSSSRPGSNLGSGYFVSNNSPGFADTPLFKNIPTLDLAVQQFYRLVETDIINIPPGHALFGTAEATPPAASATHAAFITALNIATADAASVLETTEARFGNVLSAFADTQDDFFDRTLDIISIGLDAVLIGADDNLNDSLGAIVQLITRSLQLTDLSASELFNRIGDSVELAVQVQTLLHGNFLDVLALDTGKFFERAADVIDAIESITFAKIEERIKLSRDEALDRSDVIFSRLDQTIAGIDDWLDGIIIVDDDGVAANLSSISDAIIGGPLALSAALASKITGYTGDVVGVLTDSIRQSPTEVTALEKFFFESANVFQLDRDICRDRFSRADGPEDLANNFIRLIANMVATLLYPLAIAQARAAGCLQEWAQTNPHLMLAPAESVLAHYRGLIDNDTARRNIKGVGFDDKDAQLIIDVTRPLPDEGLLLSMWLREILSDDESDRAFAGKGWTVAWTARLKKLAFFIPPAQDLITMAVREVFTPEIAESFGQFDDFPPEFARWGAAQGISEEWAKNYWAAHWSLPSIQMGFEMLHRRVIDETKLKQLMQALDIMPGWRDQLIKISFNPFTRIDIRRMNRVGVLSSEEVFEAYLDLGYNDEKARKLQEFVQRLNEPQETLLEELADELTRSNILGFYDDGIITKTVAQLLLRNAGYNVVTIDLFIDAKDFDRERKERKADIKIITERAKNGVIDFAEARSELDSLGLETRERDLALLALERVEKANVRMPGRGDLDKFVKAGLITQPEYDTNMRRLGYSGFWTSRYLKLAVTGG